MSASKGDEVPEEDDSGYKVPEKKTLEDFAKSDEKDESLQRYKQALLVPDNPNIVVLHSFSICVENQPEKTFSLLDKVDKTGGDPIVIPEGANYHIKVKFYVQRDIVTGLKYNQSVSRKGIRINRSNVMIGSYGPNDDFREWKSEVYEAPKGLIHRGTYNIKSTFTDTDKHEFVSWNWSIKITN